MDINDKRPPQIPERIGGLRELAFNLWWSWHPEARMLFKMLSRAAWKLSVHNPVKTLRDVDQKVLDAAAKDSTFLTHYDVVMRNFKAQLNTEDTAFSTPGSHHRQTLPISYFSAEYGLHHSLPFYAGGLGFLAGDFLKECSDLRIPVVAVGFVYPQGYIKQRITSDGWQVGEQEVLDRENSPMVRVLDEKGNPLVVEVPIIQPSIYVGVWRVQIGRVSLYLIDTDLEVNDPWNRGISARLYIGDLEQRLRQGIVLGIGGTKVLSVLGITCSMLHLNEGHPAFAIFERIREKREAGLSYDNAFEQVRRTTVLTTHTPVLAGHEVFPFPLMEKYFSSYWSALGLDREAFFRLGINPRDPQAGFSMTCLALRVSAFRNAVSAKHAEVARRMWQPLWPGLREDKVPIDQITNGIHVATWIEPRILLLFNKYLGSDWLENHHDPSIWKFIDAIPDEELWQAHYWLKMKLMIRLRGRARQRLREGANSCIVLASGLLLDPDALTLGFARRFAVYKRATLILRNMERLRKLVSDRWRPLQIVFAGKAHPDDNSGKQLLQQVFNAACDTSFGGRVAFVEDYDEQLAQYLVHGVDVWLNNPLPLLEACGTSGMKAALNGVPHFSILDGWWAEGFNGRNGWAFPATEGENRDGLHSEAIYDLLEKEVIPLYYRLGDNGIPHDWVKVMKEAIKSVAPFFSARRMVKEYLKKFYQNALKNTF